MSYQPDPINESSTLAIHVGKELQKLSNELRNLQIESVQYKVWNVEPDKPRTGQAYYADGTNWNPGTGEGLYIRLSTGSWSKL